eukprot:Tbor_TRINITY_DN5553_c0_g1::TRINITY_DN5553_c0_g1_i7::g.13782::m.13782/K21198/NAPG, SNAPG; gamma-soluble NSF attachment protein
MSFHKAEEAADLMRKGAKYATRSLTRWSTDPDLAASHFEKAAIIYIHLGDKKKAREASLAAADNHEKANNNYFAAKALDIYAAFLCTAPNDSETDRSEAADLYIRASIIYSMSNKPERQADMLQKVARLIPTGHAKEGARRLMEALDVLENSDKYYLAPDVYRSLILLQVRGNLLLDAVHTIKRSIGVYERLGQGSAAAKGGLEIVILCLVLGDTVLADREYKHCQEGFGFPQSPEQTTAYNILSSVETGDTEALSIAVKDSPIQFIIPDIAKLAKKIKVSGAPCNNNNNNTVISGTVVGGSLVPVDSHMGTEAKCENEEEEDLR